VKVGLYGTIVSDSYFGLDKDAHRRRGW
jgi:hypothetical protein